ncbi:exopolysaccharide biosynthesis polyprenyl glycosylphosphotransferase [Shewanella sp. JM162201]|uniref:Exopolysaccharide biosynthesis polyprenyl glycosylphosphotransferase n=2 Tax=Shewanella jiangmenensis TaxID=2837387 RepID=A0ABS5UZC7_9GAMM|nr:exopolysaccharide biosynthesis polyprenyl glycosylphosphotransferase [Shewanella jiangmenensis]
MPRAAKPHLICRLIDLAIASGILALFSVPVLLLCCYRLTKRAAIFEKLSLLDGNNRQRRVRRLAGDGMLAHISEISWVFGAGLALLGGAIRFHGLNATKYKAWPGVVNLADIERRMGLGWQQNHGAINALHRAPLRYLAALCRALITLMLLPTPRLGERKVRLLGIEIDNLSMAQLLDLLMKHAARRQSRHFAFVNTDCLNSAWQDAQYRALLAGCEGVFADGIGVRLGCHLTRQGLKDNLNGTDLFPLLCERAALEGRSIYLLGGSDGIARAAAAAMAAKYPGLVIAGCHHGFIDERSAFDKNSTLNENSSASVIEAINQSRADILLVGMGAPRQERWIAKHRENLKVGVALGVGGLFDFYSGRIPRAPLWLRQLGLEWCWRLWQEPGRMWRRYILGNPLFLLRVLAERRRVGNASNPVDLPKLDWLNTKSDKLRQRHQLRLLGGRIAKRSLDILVSSLALLILLPLFLLVALAIRLESPGAVLYRQTRAGADNRPFTMWKFRSMYLDADARLAALCASNEMSGGVLFKMRRDPRITRVGKLIRKASIDELPQLWNVLKGDMSLVGPRPALPREVAQYPNHARERLAVKPGITCIWQVSGRSELPFDTQVELDLEYIHTQSLWADVRLLVKTIPAVLSARGAY